MDTNRARATITSDVAPRNEVSAGGAPASPPPRPPTTNKESKTSKTSKNKSPFDPHRRTNGHNDIPDITVPIGSRPPGFPPVGHQRVDRFEISDRRLEELEFPQRLAVLGGPSLFGKTQSYDIELATLQRMAIHDLQHRLVRLVAHIHNNQYADDAAMDIARRLLSEYCKIYGSSPNRNAVRDYV